MPDDSLHYQSIASVARAIKARILSPVDLTRDYLERIERQDSTLGAYLAVTSERALEDARKAEAEVASGNYKGPLHGVPIGIKDLIDTEGVQTTWGTGWRRGVTAERDAAVVAILAKAGTVLLGKHSLLEFAMGGIDHNPHYGYARNPWNLKHFPGGSSSGTGVAVSAGLAAGGLGTDTGGSIRQPSSYCGIVGLKPTRGLVCMGGIFPMSAFCDTVGPMTRTVTDNALLLEGMLGAEPGSYTKSLAGEDLTGVRVGVPYAWIERDSMADVADVVLAAIDVLRGLGATIVNVPLQPTQEHYAAYRDIVFYEAAIIHEPHLAQHADEYGAYARERVESGVGITHEEHAKAFETVRDLTSAALTSMNGVDVLALPTQPTTAPLFGQGSVSIRGQVFEMVAVRGLFTIPFNLTGWPGLSVPAGFSAEKLPVGMQLVSPANQEAVLFKVAYAYQEKTDWHMHRPPVS